MAAIDDATPVTTLTNRVHWFTGRAHQVLDEATAGGACVTELTSTETAEALTELARLQSRLAGLRLRLLAHAEVVDIAAETSATSTTAWLTHATRIPHGQAGAELRCARRLHDFAATEAAALAGHLDAAQTRVVIEAVDALPHDVDTAGRARAEAHLLDLASQFDAARLKHLARHLHHVIDPDAADEALARQLAKDEATANRKTSLVLHDDGHGSCHGRFTIPTAYGAMLTVALDALASPKRPDPIHRTTQDPTEDPGHDPDDDGDQASGPESIRPTAEIMGEAFTELLELFPTDKLPTTGGGLVTVLVTIPVQLLEDGLGIATLSTGGEITAGQARRLACRAGLIPQVLDSNSVVLDQGRRVRLHTTSQRIAMAARDRHCTAPGCTIPATWCHAHHKTPWSRGGRTTTNDGTMLCPRHHRMVHDPRYETEYLPDGQTRITRHRARRQ